MKPSKGDKVIWTNLNHGGDPLKCEAEVVSIGDKEQIHMGNKFFWTVIQFSNGRKSVVSSKQLIKRGGIV